MFDLSIPLKLSMHRCISVNQVFGEVDFNIITCVKSFLSKHKRYAVAENSIMRRNEAPHLKLKPINKNISFPHLPITNLQQKSAPV